MTGHPRLGRAAAVERTESVILIVIEPQVSVTRRGGQMRKASASLASSSQLPRCAGAGDESCSSVESCDHRLFQLRRSLGCDGVEDVEAAGAPGGVEGGQHPEQRRDDDHACDADVGDLVGGEAVLL